MLPFASLSVWKYLEYMTDALENRPEVGEVGQTTRLKTNKRQLSFRHPRLRCIHFQSIF